MALCVDSIEIFLNPVDNAELSAVNLHRPVLAVLAESVIPTDGDAAAETAQCFLSEAHDATACGGGHCDAQRPRVLPVEQLGHIPEDGLEDPRYRLPQLLLDVVLVVKRERFLEGVKRIFCLFISSGIFLIYFIFERKKKERDKERILEQYT